MPDSSVSQSATAGDQSRIILVYGDNNVIGESPFLKLIRPWRASPAQTSVSADEAALLVYCEEATDFVGRQEVLEEFTTWATIHNPARPVSVRILTGRAGAGKTRFAMELCRALEQIRGDSWQAGFVRDQEARRFLIQTNLSDWRWQKPTLAVFDYAMTLTDVLPAWMEELADVQDSSHPLRILLLERHADPDSGWLKELFPGGYSLSGRLLDGRPMCLPGLGDLDIQIGIMQATLTRLGSTVALPAEVSAFRNHLARTDWAGAPLYLMMAAMVMHRQQGVDPVLSLRRTDLAKAVAQHEHSRLKRASTNNQSLQRFLAHMAALATLCGGLDGGILLDRIRQEKKSLGHEELGNDAVAHALKQLLPDGKEGVAPILPDIVGEAFLIEHLGHGQAQTSTEALLRAFPKAPTMIAAVLIRCVQDFAPATLSQEDMDRAIEQKQAVDWLHALIRHEDMPLHKLMILSNAMPENTLALRELAAALMEKILLGMRKLPERNIAQQISYASCLNNLSNRLAGLGKHKEALANAQDAVDQFRAVAQINPEFFRPKLAMSLTTLSNRFSNLGMRDAALGAAQERVELYQQSALPQSEDSHLELAMSFQNLAIKLAELSKHEKALDAAQEAIKLYRRVGQVHPEIFSSYLAGSLNNLAKIYSELGKHTEALNAAEEATDLYRELAHTRPDAFPPDYAMSLNTLGLVRARLDIRKEALDAVQESVTIYRALVRDQPDGFLPNLAMSLNNLANRLAQLDKREEALDAEHEAVKIYRSLAQTNPEGFTPALAGCLNNLANRLTNLSRRKEALDAAQEAINLYSKLMQQLPKVFDNKFYIVMLTWISIIHNISREDADTLFRKDPMAQIHALFGGLGKNMDHPTI